MSLIVTVDKCNRCGAGKNRRMILDCETICKTCGFAHHCFLDHSDDTFTMLCGDYCTDCDQWYRKVPLHHHCSSCNKCVSDEFKHCDQCRKCVGVDWIHCEPCGKCMHKSWLPHCPKCNRCCGANHYYCVFCDVHHNKQMKHCEICNKCTDIHNVHCTHKNCNTCHSSGLKLCQKCKMCHYDNMPFYCEKCNKCGYNFMHHCEGCNTCQDSNHSYCQKCKKCLYLKFHCDKCDRCECDSSHEYCETCKICIEDYHRHCTDCDMFMSYSYLQYQSDNITCVLCKSDTSRIDNNIICCDECSKSFICKECLQKLTKKLNKNASSTST